MIGRITGAAALFLALGAASPGMAAEADFQPSARAIEAHMDFLASDLLEGRLPGTRGYDIAAAYVAAKFHELGLKPAGDAGTYIQKVPLLSFRPAGEGSLAITDKAGRTTPLVFGKDYYPNASPFSAATEVAAPLVFVGYGIVAPDRGRDDYAGLDVKGKIVVFLGGAPRAWQTEERAHYGSTRNKRAAAAARGAVGMISLQTPSAEKLFPFADYARTWRSWGMTWRDANGRPHYAGGPMPALGSLSPEGAAKLFAGAPRTLEAVLAAAETPEGQVRGFAMPMSAAVSFRSEHETIESSNVAGLVEGSDPALKDEVVVLSAHLDHLGVGEPVNGDRIYNGAIDNAAGIATTLEVARGFIEGPVKPRRSLLILAVTAEEKGLIGSQFFAHNPTVPKASIVADVDLDMPMLSYDFIDVVAFGAERSSLGPSVRRAAARLGVALAPDPVPDEGIFTRSDHYRFVEQGIPAVFVMIGYGAGGQAASEAFQKDRYHKPSDDLAQPIDYRVGVKFARLNYEITRELANADERPTWNAGDFFGTLFKGPMAAR